MGRLIDANAFKEYMRSALEQTRRCYPDGGEWAEAVTEEFCRDIDEQPTVQPDHIAESDRKVSISCGQENDLISRQEALKELAAYIHLIDKTMGKGTLTDDDCMEAAKSVLGEDELPAAQPEIIRCKDCKYMIDIGDDLMCDNAKGWVVATTSDFGCVLAERRTDERHN